MSDAINFAKKYVFCVPCGVAEILNRNPQARVTTCVTKSGKSLDECATCSSSILSLISQPL